MAVICLTCPSSTQTVRPVRASHTRPMASKPLQGSRIISSAGEERGDSCGCAPGGDQSAVVLPGYRVHLLRMALLQQQLLVCRTDRMSDAARRTEWWEADWSRRPTSARSRQSSRWRGSLLTGEMPLLRQVPSVQIASLAA